jgi:hypothetical protein
MELNITKSLRFLLCKNKSVQTSCRLFSKQVEPNYFFFNNLKVETESVLSTLKISTAKRRVFLLYGVFDKGNREVNDNSYAKCCTANLDWTF